MTVEYTLIPLENALAFQITKQASYDEVKNALNSKGEFVDDNKWTIRSVSAPDIDMASKTIFLRGESTHMDNRVTTLTFGSNIERDKVRVEIETAIRRFNNRADFLKRQKELWDKVDSLAIWGVEEVTFIKVPRVKIDSEGFGNNKLPDRPFKYYFQ